MTVQRSGYTLPRLDEPGWWASYWDDIRPRFVTARVRAGRVHLRWAAPLWAFEETLRFGLLVLPWVAYAWRWMPRRWRKELARPERRRPRIAVEPSARLPWPALVAVLEGHGEGMLRLDSGEPFVLIEAGDGGREVVVEITQV